MVWGGILQISKNMESQQTVDVLALPEMAMVTRLTAASLRTLAGMLNTLADSLGQVEMAKAEVKEEVKDNKNKEDKVINNKENKDDSVNGCQEKLLRLRCDTVCSVDSGIDVDLESLISGSEASETNEEADDNLLERIEDFEAESDDGGEVRTDPETGLRVICLDEVRDHCTLEDGWTVLYDRVYQVSDLLRVHPGGEEVMAEYLGYDGTIAFQGVGHSKAAFRMLQPNLIGILPQEERLNFSL